MSALIELFRASTPLYGGNAAFVEDLYERYLQDPESVDLAWRERFDAMHQEAANEVPHGPVRQNFLRLAQESRTRATARSTERLEPAAAEKQSAVLRLINAYRFRGHQVADLDPLGLRDTPKIGDLDPAYHHLGDEDLDQVFHTGSLYAPDRMPLREILALVRQIYCGTVGSEYMHITNTQEKRWIQKRLEGYRATPELETSDRRWLLTLLTAAEGIEKYLHARYVGQKRFSLEGGEALIPLLDELIQRAGRKGLKEIVIGMAHRGRLNVLTNILGKPPQDIFDEFEGRAHLNWRELAGDVKYHMGFSTDIDSPGGIVHVALGFNPSHLEIINPVIEGSVRARQRRRGDHTGDEVLPLLDPRRLGLRRAGRGHGDPAAVPDAQLLHRRHPACRDQQPDRIHHQQPARRPLHPLLHGRGEDGPGARLPCQRRRSRGGDLRHPHGARFPQPVPQGRHHRPRLLPAAGPQRGGRAGGHPADDVQAHPLAADLARGLRGPAGGRRLVSRDEAAAMIEDYRSSIEHGVVVARPVLCGLGQGLQGGLEGLLRLSLEPPHRHRGAAGDDQGGRGAHA